MEGISGEGERERQEGISPGRTGQAGGGVLGAVPVKGLFGAGPWPKVGTSRHTHSTLHAFPSSFPALHAFFSSPSLPSPLPPLPTLPPLTFTPHRYPAHTIPYTNDINRLGRTLHTCYTPIVWDLGGDGWRGWHEPRLV